MTAPVKTLKVERETAPPAPPMEITVARTLDELMQVMNVRSQAFIGDQSCPYAEEFDGNDFAGATHFLLRIGGEPAGTARMRWFGEFAKLERVAVTAAFRGSQAAIALIQAGSDLASRKGYKKMLAYGQPKLLPYWQAMFGEDVVQPRRDRNGFVFSDHQYVEMVIELDQVEDALTLEDAPLRLNRPEGEWDRAGVLDRSARRGATNPMRGRSSRKRAA